MAIWSWTRHECRYLQRPPVEVDEHVGVGLDDARAARDDTCVVEIRTNRLVLRKPRLTDLPAVVAACQDPEIPRFIPYVPVPYGEHEGRAFLESVERAWNESDERTFAVCGDDDTLVGAVTVRLHEGGTVGYWLAPSARGQGLMTEAVQAVVRWAREKHGIQSLRLWTHPENIASQAVAERAGFVREDSGSTRRRSATERRWACALHSGDFAAQASTGRRRSAARSC